MSRVRIADPSSNRALVQEEVRRHLRARRCKLTPARNLMLEEIFGKRVHFTAEDLAARMSQGGGRVALATIYRFLRELVRGGFLRELNLGDGRRHFDPNHATEPQHHHIRCMDCGELVEFEDPCTDLRERALADQMGFCADSLSIQVHAHCRRQTDTADCPNHPCEEAADGAGAGWGGR